MGRRISTWFGFVLNQRELVCDELSFIGLSIIGPEMTQAHLSGLECPRAFMFLGRLSAQNVSNRGGVPLAAALGGDALVV